MKAGDKIAITKPGKFEGLAGEIISNNELADKPLTVKLGDLGTWSFKPTDVSAKMIQPLGPEFIKEANEFCKNVEKAKAKVDLDKPKRAYKKRSDKAKEVKPKRKYVRKNVDK